MNENARSDIAYIYDVKLCEECNRLPTMLNRASRVQDLINSYNLLNYMTVISSTPATEDELKLCHSSSYIEVFKNLNDKDCDEAHEEEYGLSYDCPVLDRSYDFATVIAGGSITAAKCLMSDQVRIAINWFGGWHHAQRDEAEGFCYVNDIVIAIQKMLEKFPRILYLDLDIHHGNGVQNAFEISQKVLTLSFHKFVPGFYPGTGSLDDIGFQKGQYFSLNVPFLEGLSDETYLKVFNAIFPKVFNSFKPAALVIQCGADGIIGDPLGECNLTPKAVGECIQKILKLCLPTLFLGGGGYNFANTARHWTYLTSIICDKTLNSDIPDVSEYFVEYGPSYEINITSGCQKDWNNDDHINKVNITITQKKVRAIMYYLMFEDISVIVYTSQEFQKSYLRRIFRRPVGNLTGLQQYEM